MSPLVRTRFVRDARRVVADAACHAGGLGALQVEAQHLLLALTGTDGTRDLLAQALSNAGHSVVDLHAAVATGLHDRRLLEGLGVTVDDSLVAAPALPGAHSRRRPEMAPETKRCLTNALRSARALQARRIVPGHVLLGVLWTPGSGVGVLTALGVDTGALGRTVAARLTPVTA